MLLIFDKFLLLIQQSSKSKHFSNNAATKLSYFETKHRLTWKYFPLTNNNIKKNKNIFDLHVLKMYNLERKVSVVSQKRRANN